MKNHLLLCMALMVSLLTHAQNADWLRYSSISPDGSQLAFNYKGNIYLVPSTGGTARPLTISGSYNFKAVWSPDGQQIAFASDRHGNYDVFVVSVNTGATQRLTYHSNDDLPQGFSPDGKQVYFLSSRIMNKENVQFPYGRFNQLYAVAVDGKTRPVQQMALPMDDIQWNKAGNKMLYIDLKGYEDIWRKHHVSSVTRDVWMYDQSTDQHKMLTQFAGEDRNPIWANDQKHVLYLSEQSGSLNIWKMNSENPSELSQLTQFDTHPVRFISLANNGTIAFSYHGQLYTLQEGQTPRKLSIQIPFEQDPIVSLQKISTGADEIALSPNGKEIAFIVRGEVFVTGTESGLTKRITNTPTQERSVSFSSDGRKLLYAGERNGSWNLYEAKIARSEEPYFYASTLLEESTLLATPTETFQPLYSPDGKEVAYLEERTTLKVLNLASKQTRVVLPGDKNYSYSDGDQHYQWSPDSQWFLVGFIENGRWVTEVGLVKADGRSPVVNLSKSGYDDDYPHWAFGGKAVVFISDKQGFRSHGSWGAQSDIYAMFFDQEAHDRYKLSKDEFEILKEKEKNDKKDEPADTKEKDKKSKKESTPAVDKTLKLNVNGIEDRIERLTLSSFFLAGMALHPEGEKLYYLSSRDNSYDLWELNLRERSTKTIGNFKGGGANLIMDEKGENVYVLVGGNITQVKTADGKSKGVGFNAEMYLDKAGEYTYFFEHMWRQVDKKFYDPSIHGINWKGYKEAYQPFVVHINNNRDFAEMMSELLGELNGSHTGCRYSHSDPKGDQTAALGIFIDEKHSGAGIKIAEIIDKSPLQLANATIKAGAIIEKIDGQSIAAGQHFYPLLNHKVGKQVLLQLLDPASGQRQSVVVKPISLGAEQNLLYERWVKLRNAETERLSGGKVGYVHVRGMNSSSFREVYSDLLGKHQNKEAVVVDSRFNGGGWLHDDLATLLSGKQYVTFAPRGQVIGAEPQGKWYRPSVVLMGEGNYSDAHGFPIAYKAMGVGELVGMPVPGTMTAVWWERQIDPSLVFGIPQMGVQDLQGNYLENQQLNPDHQIKNKPTELINGKDAQLEKAVELMLKQIGDK